MVFSFCSSCTQCLCSARSHCVPGGKSSLQHSTVHSTVRGFNTPGARLGEVLPLLTGGAAGYEFLLLDPHHLEGVAVAPVPQVATLVQVVGGVQPVLLRPVLSPAPAHQPCSNKAGNWLALHRYGQFSTAGKDDQRLEHPRSTALFSSALQNCKSV